MSLTKSSLVSFTGLSKEKTSCLEKVALMAMMKASVLRMGGTIASPNKGIFTQSIWVELYIFGFIFLYLSDITPFPPRALSVYASIPLAFLGVLYFHKATPTLRYLCVTLALSWTYQQIMTGEVGLKAILATFATFFITIYYQQMGEEGLERLKICLMLFFILSFGLFIVTMLSDIVLRLREGLYWGITSEDRSISLQMFRGQGGLATLKFFFGYQVAAGIGLFIGETYKRGINKSILLICFLSLSALTLILCGERSVLVAVAIILLVLGFVAGKIWKIIVLGLLFISLYFPLNEVVKNITAPTQETVIQRVMDEKQQAGSFERLEVQLWALSQIPFYPLGIIEQGVDYKTLVRKGNFANPIAPHNGYITRVLACGWFLILINLLVFYKLINIVRIIKRKKLYIILPVLGGLLGALANALFHNPSFLTFSTETVILLMLFAGYFDYSVKKRFQYQAGHRRLVVS